MEQGPFILCRFTDHHVSTSFALLYISPCESDLSGQSRSRRCERVDAHWSPGIDTSSEIHALSILRWSLGDFRWYVNLESPSPGSRAWLQLLYVLIVVGSMYMMGRLVFVSEPSADCGCDAISSRLRDLVTLIVGCAEPAEEIEKVANG